ncbi:CLUMA_CG008440, isoform A [Clunio marinus]|uniref:CLUMA_CG008440, isoform A n=1 Tax=Clunio marinus TaxID=568069 RepID=A0A1J1I3R7_9DIPT|nr:CLUMA_CG008440, isoform A [Clunio marinus]
MSLKDEENLSRKRKIESDEESEEKNAKRKFLTSDPQFALLHLPDEVLIEILSYLDSESLRNLGQTCLQLKLLSQDKKLWTHMNFTSREFDFWEILKRLKLLLVTTKSLNIQGDCKEENMHSRPMPNRQTFKEIIKRIVNRSPLIQHLLFKKVWFDWTRNFSISKFPANLRSLSFSRCIMPKVRNHRMVHTFTGIVEHMPQLEELRIEYCNFFESNDVMPFSKLQNLKILSLRGCRKMKNCVPYLSLACRFGFPKLEVFDLRETNVCDGELNCLNSIKSLKELYLEHRETEQRHESDDEDDFELFLRRTRRPSRRLNNTEQSPRVAPREPVPSTSRHLDNNDGDSSSSESFSDSMSSSSSSSSNEDMPYRTIVIRANINPEEPVEENPPNAANPPVHVVLGNNYPHARRYLQFGINSARNYEPLTVSDRGMLGFGFPRPNLLGNLVYFGSQPPDHNTYLERIVLRNFRNITDTTLSHFETNAPRLIQLDVRGCPQITREAVERFKAARTQCELSSNYDNEE